MTFTRNPLVFYEVGSTYVKIRSASVATSPDVIFSRNVLQSPSGGPTISGYERLSSSEVRYFNMNPSTKYTFYEVVNLNGNNVASSTHYNITTLAPGNDPVENPPTSEETLVSWTDTNVPAGHYWYRAIVTDDAIEVETNYDDAEVTGVNTPDPDDGNDPDPPNDPDDDPVVPPIINPLMKRVEQTFSQLEPNRYYWFRATVAYPLSHSISGVPQNWQQTESNSDVAWLSQPDCYSVIISKIGVVTNGENPLFLARIERGPTASRKPIRPRDITSITYSVSRRGTYLSESNETAIAGHQLVNVPVFPWVLERPVNDYEWTTDATGYNFIHCIDLMLGEPFPTPGNYEVTYLIKLKWGKIVPIKFQLNTVG